MKLGEIKLEALRIMNINNDSVLLLDRFDSLLGEKKYAKYLNNMYNCINKAIDIINHKGILPQNTMPLAELPLTKSSVNNRFDISQITDFLSISRIVYEDNVSNYCARIPYEREGNKIVVSNDYFPEFLTLIYNTKIQNISENLTDKEGVPGLSDELARLIPYYIKFELYQEDEPDLALNAKNTFEQGIEALRVGDAPQEEFSIERIFSSEGYC